MFNIFYVPSRCWIENSEYKWFKKNSPLMVLIFQKRRWSIVCKAWKGTVCLMVRMLQRKIMQDDKGCRRCVLGGCLRFSVGWPLSDIWAAKVIFEQRSEGNEGIMKYLPPPHSSAGHHLDWVASHKYHVHTWRKISDLATTGCSLNDLRKRDLSDLL